MRFRRGYLWQASSSDLAEICDSLAGNPRKVHDSGLQRELTTLSASWRDISLLDPREEVERQQRAIKSAALRKRMIEIITRVGDPSEDE